ncbi:MAG TPA: hypothetical protein VFH68_16715 [Polyangia bacterium]|nr:hypothetical protein [Polyangia bacterium]
MKLIEKPGTRQESPAMACANLGIPAVFNADPEVGFTSYYALDGKGQPDYNKGSLAVQTTEIGTYFFNAEGEGIPNTAMDGGKVYSFGPYAVTEPDANNICTVPTMSPTHVVLAAIPAVPDDPATPDDESAPGQPAIDAMMVWTNVRVYVTAASFGSQVQADLVFTRRGPTGETCTIGYNTVAMAPAVPCRMADADGNPMMNADGTYVVDPAACDPANGSGISPNTDYMCAPDSGFCVVNGETIPALK